MENTLQLKDLPTELKRGEQHYNISIKSGGTMAVAGKALGDKCFYYKHDGRYWLSLVENGYLVTSSRTIRELKALVQDPAFFDEKIDPKKIMVAVSKWADDRGWIV